MKKIICLVLFLYNCISYAQTIKPPHLANTSSATQLMVHGKPFLILGGELHNSSTSTAAYMKPIWKQMKDKNLNTVVAPVYWELLEPEEGKFDFALVDSMLLGARQQKLHLVILWFASWKNGYSTYVPSWVKNSGTKYPRAKDKHGNNLQHLSTFADATAQADANAFKALMKHLHEVDAKQQTVIMVQIENEVGLFGTARDHSEIADTKFNGPVPADLVKYMIGNKGKMQPELDSVWKINGYKTSGTWTNVFGKGTTIQNDWRELPALTEELFTAYHYAKFIGRVAAAGKSAYPIPMYVNAWIKQPTSKAPGNYPAGGPIPHTLDIWRAAAPAVDFIAPDIYIPEVAYTVRQYHRPGNPIFVPEIKPGIGSANEAFWILGEHDAIGISPFGVDESKPADDPITKTYAVLQQVKHLVLQHQGRGTMKGIFLDSTKRKMSFELDGYQVEAKLGNGSVTQLAGFSVGQQKTEIAGGLLFSLGNSEFIAVGKDYGLTFTPLKPNGRVPDIDYMDEGYFVNGKWVTTRRLNGDESTGGGDYGFGSGYKQSLPVKFQPSATGDYKIIKFKIYSY